MFCQCKNLEEAKKLFRELAMYLHPDKGGDARLMSILTDAYENIKNILESIDEIKKEDIKEKKFEYSYENVFYFEKDKISIF